MPLATIDLDGDNIEFEAFRHILSCYTHYSWLIVLDLQSFITICPWLPLVGIATIDLVGDYREFEVALSNHYGLVGSSLFVLG